MVEGKQAQRKAASRVEAGDPPWGPVPFCFPNVRYFSLQLFRLGNGCADARAVTSGECED